MSTVAAHFVHKFVHKLRSHARSAWCSAAATDPPICEVAVLVNGSDVGWRTSAMRALMRWQTFGNMILKVCSDAGQAVLDPANTAAPAMLRSYAVGFTVRRTGVHEISTDVVESTDLP
jgi:hypothetical protein